MTMNPNNQTLAKAVDTSKSVHLSASAGSGKTRALKDRYLALLDRMDRSGLGLDQAVAITFTDKAAAEIKERVMRDLPEPLLKKIIRGRQDLRISTIHSFCMNLLKRYPLEAGLPPDFGVLDARDQASQVQRAIEDALEASDRDQEIMAPLRDFTADELIDSIGFLISIRSRLKRREIDAGGPTGLLAAVRESMGMGQAENELRAFLGSAPWRSSLRYMEMILRPQGDRHEESRGREHLLLAEEQDVDVALGISGALFPVYFTNEGKPRKNPFIAKKAYSGKNRDAYEQAFFQLQEMLGQLRDLHARLRSGREALSLLRLYLHAEERYQESKLRAGLLDFDDLETYAYGLLKSREFPDILYWLDRKILHFLVDEFQDTSDIQWAILEQLTGELFAGQGADKPMAPTLFVVGDEKQSIYRFREANYRLIENVREKMERNLPPGSREVLTLDKNFRSAPQIIETVNTVFSALWGEAYQPSVADRAKHTGSVRLLELLPGNPDDNAAGLTEAAVLAQEIRKIVSGKTVIYEKEGEGWRKRPAGYADCAVLIQSRTRLKEYEAALRTDNIPYRVVGGIGFYEEEEVQALLNVLFFLWNRDDALALAAALKSPLFGLTDKDLFDLMQGNRGLFEGLRRARPDAGDLLHGWAREAGLMPLAGLIHRIITDTGAYVRFGRRNPQAIFNLDKLIDTAREFDRRGYTTLQDFVEWVRNIRETEQREATADMNLPGFQGAVSIMTVHKAKGLEFPVVFLPGMHQQPRSISTSPPAIIEDDAGAVRMAIKDPESPLYDEMWKREQEELRREHQRLLYVAMTRARDHLVMLGMVENNRTEKQNTWLNYLRQSLPGYEKAGAAGPCLISAAWPDWQARIVPEEQAGEQGPAQQELRPEPAVDAIAVIRNISPVQAAKAPEWKKATDYISRDKEWPLEQPAGQPAVTVSLLVRGSMLHRCLEDLAKNGTYNAELIAKEFPEVQALEKEGREAFLRDVASVLGSVRAQKDLAWIFERQANAYAELPFLYRKGHDLISGVIDRLIIKEGKGFVVDYKAILIEHEEALDAWKDHYRPQIKIYCEAVKEIFRLPVVEGYLLFLDSAMLTLAASA